MRASSVASSLVSTKDSSSEVKNIELNEPTAFLGLVVFGSGLSSSESVSRCSMVAFLNAMHLNGSNLFSLRLFCFYYFSAFFRSDRVMEAQRRLCFTIFSRWDSRESSSSGRQRMVPISERVRPRLAAFLRSMPEILMFLRQMGLKSKFSSRRCTSESMSSALIYYRVLGENGKEAWSYESQTRSKEQTSRLSGMVMPWSIGTRRKF